MSVRQLLVLFVFCPVAAFSQSHDPRNTDALKPSTFLAALQPPIQPAAEPTPEPNPTSQPPQPDSTTQPAAAPLPEPNPTSQPAPAQPAPIQDTPAPVVRVERAPARARAAEKQENKDNDKPVSPAELHNTSLWHDPGNIAGLNLFYGQGGQKSMPVAPFVFEAEDHSGTNPKFDVRDSQGKKWRVKLGEEVRPEVVASRLLWATGYYVNDDYVLTTAEIQDLHISRGASMVKHGRVAEARFARKPSGQKKIGIWKWKENPFTGTREFNGLRVMMAVMNSWDLKDINNAVFEDSRSGKELFLMSDVGATFGTNGLSWTNARSKGNADSFKDSKFIEKTTATTVSFGTPKPPTARLIEAFVVPELKDYARRADMRWIGEDIPRQDARWIASLLKQLSHQQLVDAFRAGHFPPDEIEAYVDVVESRIHELSTL